MLTTSVSGYYDGTGIIMDEEVSMTVGQKVIITILSQQEPEKPASHIQLEKYMGRGEKMFSMDAGEYVKGLRFDDRI